MRAAPAALWPGDPFAAGCRAAAITHGHPSGYRPAGVPAATRAGVVVGGAARESLDAAIARLRAMPGHAEPLATLEAAIRLAGTPPRHDPRPLARPD